MSDFIHAFQFTKPWEGGDVNDPDDPGGATRDGISLRTARKMHPIIDMDKDNDGDVDADDIFALDDDDIEFFFKTVFWNGNEYARINDQLIANRVYDASVNMGPRQSGRCIQRAVNCAMGGDELLIDGWLGDYSFKAINELQDVGCVIPAFRADRWGVFRWIMNKEPVLKKYSKGWTRRALS